MGVVYHARYLVWLDVARTEHLAPERHELSRPRGRPGLRLAVSEVAVRYRQPARYDDPSGFAAGSRDLASRRVDFGYAVEHDEDNRLLATATTCAPGTGPSLTLTRLPDEVRSALRAHLQIRSAAARVRRASGYRCPSSRLRLLLPGARAAVGPRPHSRKRWWSSSRPCSPRRTPAICSQRSSAKPRGVRTPSFGASRPWQPAGSAICGRPRCCCRILDEPDSTVRVAAAFALGLLRDTAAVQPLIDRLTGQPPLDGANRRGGDHRARQDRRTAERRLLRLGALSGKCALSQADRHRSCIRSLAGDLASRAGSARGCRLSVHRGHSAPGRWRAVYSLGRLRAPAAGSQLSHAAPRPRSGDVGPWPPARSPGSTPTPRSSRRPPSPTVAARRGRPRIPRSRSMRSDRSPAFGTPRWRRTLALDDGRPAAQRAGQAAATLGELGGAEAVRGPEGGDRGRELSHFAGRR